MNKKIVFAALAGIAVGAAAGLLLAPEKGSKLRKRLSRKGTNAKEDLMEKVEAGISSLKDMKKSLFTSLENTVDEAKDKVSKLS